MKDNTNITDTLSLTRGKGFIDDLKYTGKLRIELRDQHGVLKDSRDITNLVVNAGKTHVRGLMKDKSAITEMSAIGVGTGSSAAAAADVDLGAEVTTGLSGTRKSVTRSNSGSFATQYDGTFLAGECTNSALTEAGIFNNTAVGPSSGTMLCRAVFTAIDKLSTDSLSISWVVTVG